MAAAPPVFERLRAELDLWAGAGRAATLWWRDDDAVAVTPGLERLRALSVGAAVPVGLAVIPASADPSLAGWLPDWPGVAVLQHGIAHADHAAPGERKVELGGTREPAAILADLTAAFRGMAGLAPLPVLVPPWNRIAPAVVEGLPASGYRVLSTFGPRTATAPAGPGRVNVHADLMRGRAFAGDEAALAAVTAHLAARRRGAADPAEPTGLLTHHRVHDDACWTFVERFLSVCAGHPAVRWVSPRGFVHTDAPVAAGKAVV